MYLGVHHSRQEADHRPRQQSKLLMSPVNQPSQWRVRVVWESAARDQEGGLKVAAALVSHFVARFPPV